MGSCYVCVSVFRCNYILHEKNRVVYNGIKTTELRSRQTRKGDLFSLVWCAGCVCVHSNVMSGHIMLRCMLLNVKCEQTLASLIITQLHCNQSPMGA